MSLRRYLTSFLAILLAITQTVAGVATAQPIEDNEDPVIIHRQADSPGVAGELQTFLARVYDDVEVVEVTLYYRQSAVAGFQSIAMRPLLDSIGEYMIAIETDISEYPGLQYYIEAMDASGNITSRGYSYAPIILPLEAPENPPADVAPPPPVIAERADESSGFSNSSLLLGIGAVLLLGALAGGGGGDDGGTGTPEQPGAITLTIISDTPSGN